MSSVSKKPPRAIDARVLRGFRATRFHQLLDDALYVLVAVRARRQGRVVRRHDHEIFDAESRDKTRIAADEIPLGLLDDDVSRDDVVIGVPSPALQSPTTTTSLQPMSAGTNRGPIRPLHHG